MGLMNIKKQCKRCQDVFTESGSINPYKKESWIMEELQEKSEAMAEKKIRNLNPEEIECRVGTVMEQGITLLLYKKCQGRSDNTG